MAFKLLSALKNQHLYSLMGNVVSAFFNLLSFAILVRLLAPGAFGEWVLFLATYTMLDLMRTALLQSGLIKFYAGVSEYRGRKVVGAAWYVAITLTLAYLLICGILGFLAPSFLSPVWQQFMRWLGPMLVFSLPFNFASWLLQSSHKFDKILQLRVVQNGSFLVLLCTLYVTGYFALPNVLYAYSLALALTSIYSLFFRWTQIRTIFFRTRSRIRELVVYGRLIVGSMLTSSALNYSDSFIIRTMINPAAVAMYSIPQKFMEVIEIILRSFVATAQPAISAAVNRDDWPGVARAFCRYTGVVTIIIIPFILIAVLLTKPFILILADSTYLPATDVVRIFLLSAILYPIDRFLGVTLDMINKPNLNFYKSLLKLGINILGDFLFIWWFMDIRAVAAVSVLHLIAGVAFGYFCLQKYLHFSWRDIIRLGVWECRNVFRKVLAKIGYAPDSGAR